MPEKVYFASMRARDLGQNTSAKIRRLLAVSGITEMIDPGDLAAIKLHFGEWGNESYIHPVHARQVVECVKESGGKPFLTDSNTLYLGSRSNAVDHLRTAIEHGFAYSVVGAPVVIADGLKGRNYRVVDIRTRHFQNILVSGAIADADAMIVLSHFKGHDVAGFGGAIKNLAMGCAPPQGKQAQHCARPQQTKEKCTGCGRCIRSCPAGALSLVGDAGWTVAHLDYARCIGCFECMTVCPSGAIDLDWKTDIPEFIERMVEYAYGIACGRKDKTGYMNFLLRITPDCDCVPWSDASIVPDIGILASRDPVAIDAASYDLVNAERGYEGSLLGKNLSSGEDKFRGVWAHTNGPLQVHYAEEIGLGHARYELVTIT